MTTTFCDCCSAPSEFDEDCLAFYGTLLTGNKKHWCPEWDYLPIDDTCEEFKACTCYQGD